MTSIEDIIKIDDLDNYKQIVTIIQRPSEYGINYITKYNANKCGMYLLKVMYFKCYIYSTDDYECSIGNKIYYEMIQYLLSNNIKFGDRLFYEICRINKLYPIEYMLYNGFTPDLNFIVSPTEYNILESIILDQSQDNLDLDIIKILFGLGYSISKRCLMSVAKRSKNASTLTNIIMYNRSSITTDNFDIGPYESYYIGTYTSSPNQQSRSKFDQNKKRFNKLMKDAYSVIITKASKNVIPEIGIVNLVCDYL
jgi:hypothetical protein